MRLHFQHLSDTALKRGIKQCRWLVSVATLLLIALCLAWEIAWAPSPWGAWLALKALPLSLALGGLLSHRLYTYRWLSLLIWLYFIEGVVQAGTGQAPQLWLGLAEVMLSLLIFAGCIAYVQLRLQNGLRQGSQAPHE